jgi:alanyl-tRNA synthetase
MQTDAKETKRQLKDLQTRLSTFEAAALAGQAEARGSLQLVAAALDGWDQNGLKAIATAIAARPGHVAMLFSVPPPSAVVIARAADSTIDSGAMLKQLIGRFGGKGGGRPELAQGGGLQGAADDLVSFARGLL